MRSLAELYDDRRELWRALLEYRNNTFDMDLGSERARRRRIFLRLWEYAAARDARLAAQSTPLRERLLAGLCILACFFMW